MPSGFTNTFDAGPRNAGTSTDVPCAPGVSGSAVNNANRACSLAEHARLVDTTPLAASTDPSGLHPYNDNANAAFSPARSRTTAGAPGFVTHAVDAADNA